MEATEDTPPAHLILIVDLSPSQWQASASAAPNNGMDLSTFMSQVLIFTNCHLACRQENSVSVLGAFPGKSLTLYPTPEENMQPASGPGPEAESNTYHGFRSVDDVVMERIQAELVALTEEQTAKPIALVPSLTQALCQINRMAPPQQLPGDKPTGDKKPTVDSRILILSASPDASTPYIPFMNSIFSAQKLRVPIDVCKVFGPDTIFLQQAAYLTGGCYLNLDASISLLQSLTMCFLPAASLRKTIELPNQGKVDFRASCFCHKDVVDMGYVCSACLSIFCKPVVDKVPDCDVQEVAEYIFDNKSKWCKGDQILAQYRSGKSVHATDGGWQKELRVAIQSRALYTHPLTLIPVVESRMSSSPPNARFKCKHCGIMFSKRSNWTRHESNANVHRKPPRRRPGAPSTEGEKSQSESSTSGMSPVRGNVVPRLPATEPEGLSTRRRSKAAEAERKRQLDNTSDEPEPVHEAPTQCTDVTALKITIRPRRSKRPRLSSTGLSTTDEKPLFSRVKEVEPTPLSLDQPHQRHRAPNLDARNARFKKWVRIIRLARWVPGETAPGTPNPLPRQLVRQRAREYAEMMVEPGSKVPNGIDAVYDVDWREVLRAFRDSTHPNGEPIKPTPIEDLGESSTDSDSSLWDSD
ncbi:RNA polymerase II transcription factor B subunit 4 [Ceratobasidium sp. 392]|nr:RNA polymerase II transcription factor B subunit 4 [Ceratobasidium sp. 392]